MRWRPARFSLRLAIALAGTISMSLGVVLLPWAAGSMAAAQAAPAAATASATSTPSSSATATPTPTATPTATATPTPTPSPSDSPSPRPSKTHAPPALKAPRGGTVVRGPHLLDPAKGKLFPYASEVSVSQVGSLVNQVVQVSWTGFTPSTSVTYDPGATLYPVMVAECAGTDPRSDADCFGADNGGVAGQFSQFGPMNTAYATTASNGSGTTDIELLTAEEDSKLGCKRGHPCSLVIVPAQGGNIFDSPVKCGDHSQDQYSATGAYSFTATYGGCSWRNRIVVPLRFAPTPSDCPIRKPDFSVIGSPMLGRAMSSWQAALCTSSAPISIQYDSAQNEPLARQDFQSGLDDVALTTLPATGTSEHKYVYAPVSISAESVAFAVDNPKTGKPLTHLKLDPRLIAKMLTQSYDFEHEGCDNGRPPPGVGCDNAVDNDPASLFADPEFKQLNHHIAFVGDGFQVPTVVSGQSDMTWELTRWIAASKAAKSFVDGTFDPWGEHVNTNYLDMQLPTATLSSMDPYPPVEHRYSPVYPLSQVAQYQVENWYPATSWEPDPQGNFDKLDPEVPGNRALFAILDQGDAAAFSLPVAALENAAGNYVYPTTASMLAAVEHDMTTAKNKVTQQIDPSRKVKDAYPLTMVIYAMVPTSGVSKSKAAKIAQWLDFIAGQGQAPGDQPGDLPAGYVPLTPQMRAETLKAAKDVLDQTGNKHAKSTPGSSAAAAATPSPSSSTVIGLGNVADPMASGPARYAVPALLIIGGMLAVAASLSLVVGRSGATAIARLRRIRVPVLKKR
jgi:hypothetical protein